MRLLISAAIMLLMMVPTASFAKDLTFSAKPNEKFSLGWRSPFDKNCKVKRLEKYTITKKPSLGKLSFRTEKRVVERVSKSSLNHCLGKRLKSSVVYYKAGKKSGTDRFSYYRVTRGKKVKFNVKVKIR